MLLIKRGLPAGEIEVAEYIRSWKRLIDSDGDTQPHELQRQLFAHMYGNLDILDSKTNSLLQMTGILVAAYTFVVSSPSLHLDDEARSLVVVGVVYAATAIFLCLRVIWVHWSSSDDLENAKQHLESLIKVRSERTIRFRRAWTFSSISLAALAILLVNQTVLHVFLPLDRIVIFIVILHLCIVYIYDDLILYVHRLRAYFKQKLK